MSRWTHIAGIALAVAGCTGDEVSFGEVEVIAIGNGRARVRACLDAEFLSCSGEAIALKPARCVRGRTSGDDR